MNMSNPEIAQALVDLVEMGLVVDSGQRRFENGKWRIVWVAVPPEERKQHEKAPIARRKN
jgi:predicted transcriptional regulator